MGESAPATSADSRSGPLTPTFDLRTQSEPNDYYLIFAGRGGGEVGHAFVVWVTYDRNRRFVSQEARGMHPDAQRAYWRLAVGVPGGLQDDARENRGLARRIVVRVNKHAYDRTLRVRGQWQRGTYRLVSRDCVSFVADVARASGLTAPARTASNSLPVDYLNALWAENRWRR